MDLIQIIFYIILLLGFVLVVTLPLLRKENHLKQTEKTSLDPVNSTDQEKKGCGCKRKSKIIQNNVIRFVTSRLMGGLGNQLFQIATAYAYSIENGHQLVFDKHVKFLETGAIRSTYYNSILSFVNHADVDNMKWENYQENGFHYTKIPDMNRNVKLVGYFQSEKYFSKYKEDIIKLFLKFTYNNPLYKNQLPFYHDKPIISIHFRRGDYVGHPLHTSQTFDYYKNAVKYIQGLIKSQFILCFFSDDMNWVKENKENIFGNLLPKQIEYMENNSPEQDLIYMSMCDHHILANSSFSWWGCYLKKEQGHVVAPKIWFNNHQMNWSDIYLPNWKII